MCVRVCVCVCAACMCACVIEGGCFFKVATNVCMYSVCMCVYAYMCVQHTHVCMCACVCTRGSHHGLGRIVPDDDMARVEGGEDPRLVGVKVNRLYALRLGREILLNHQAQRHGASRGEPGTTVGAAPWEVIMLHIIARACGIR